MKHGSQNSPASAAIFVWGGWILLAFAALAFVWRYGFHIPYDDDWDNIAVLTGHQPLTVSWLWTLQAGEHRIPIPKLVWLGLFKFAPNGFHVGSFVIVLSLAALAFAMIQSAKKIRGRLSYLDAFFPLAVLNLGHWENLVAWWQINLILSPILVIVLLLFLFRAGPRPTRTKIIIAGVCLMILPFCGPTGLPYVVGIGLWLFYLGIIFYRSKIESDRQVAVFTWISAAVSIGFVASYFLSFRVPAFKPPNPGLKATVRTFLEFFSVMLGPKIAPVWLFAGIGMIILVVICAAAIAVSCYTKPSERVTGFRDILVLGASIGVGAGIAWARACFGPGAGLESRYTTLALPGLVSIYLIATLRQSRRGAIFVQILLFTCCAVLLPLNVSAAFKGVRPFDKRMQAVYRDIQAGIPISVLAPAHSSFLHAPPVNDPDPSYFNRQITDSLIFLKRAGIPPFSSIAAERNFERVSIPIVPNRLNQVTWGNGVAEGLGPDPYLVFALGRPENIVAVELRFSYERTPSPATIQLFWRRRHRDNFAESERSATFTVPTIGDAHKVTALINDSIDELRVDPDVQPCVFKISAITLLLPPPSGALDPNTVEGALDVADGSQIAGWLWDKRMPDGAVNVRIYETDELVATLEADKYRADLLDAGKGNGRHGFIFAVPNDFRDGKIHVIRVTYPAGSAELPGSPAAFVVR